MVIVNSHSCIGYGHVKTKKPCQDYSASYVDPSRSIVTCCDGHGGKAYIRSQVGSRLASEAVIEVFRSLSQREVTSRNTHALEESIRMAILCKWNALVERHVSRKHISKAELSNLDEDSSDMIKENYVRAYGTTLSGAMVIGKKLIVVGIGDTEVLGLSKGEIIRLLSSDDDPAGNVTYSMCQEDSYRYLRVRVLDFKDYDGVILCTDGLSSPYQSYSNFKDSFVCPWVSRIIKSKSTYGLNDFIDRVALELGVGDDVSMAMLLKSNTARKYYERKG